MENNIVCSLSVFMIWVHVQVLVFCFSKLVLILKYKAPSRQLILGVIDNALPYTSQDFQNNIFVESGIEVAINLDTNKK